MTRQLSSLGALQAYSSGYLNRRRPALSHFVRLEDGSVTLCSAGPTTHVEFIGQGEV